MGKLGDFKKGDIITAYTKGIHEVTKVNEHEFAHVDPVVHYISRLNSTEALLENSP